MNSCPAQVPSANWAKNSPVLAYSKNWPLPPIAKKPARVQTLLIHPFEYVLRRLTYMKHWWCMECDTEVQLGKHGQCGTCGSQAVDSLPISEEVTRSVSAPAADSDAAQTSA
jgi:hypothetical protein